ncbi:MAG: MBOAT family protein [Ruminococcaceae bacterium]|nr:MBOAT family protein [Oscillospiraceae bacterium]
MLFSSIPFLFYFLPIVILLYFAVPNKFRNAVLLLSSLFFYGWGEPRFLFFMIISIIQGYVFGLLIEKHKGTKRSKVFLTASVVLSLGLLGYCKYADFFIENFNVLTGLSVPLLGIALPIGISFYTFQILSYAVDVYRGDVPAQRNFITLAAYIAMFPQLIAGPIVRYSDVAKQLENRTHSFEKASEGIRRFVIGFSKKILLANTLGELVATFKASDDKSVLFYWLYALAYMLHVYFDFSGYSDMAIGLGKIFGFDFMENFNYPYISGSITEFWRRWHMSLGSWFRDYLYIPMGGNRVSTPRWLFNILVVWMATGFWHGAAWNFVLWGLMFAVLLTIEKLFLMKGLKKLKVLNHIYVLFFVCFSFVLFDSLSISEAAQSMGAMLGAGKIPLMSAETLYYLKSYSVLLIAGIVGATPLCPALVKKVQKTNWGAVIVNIAEPLVLLTLLVVCTAYLIDGSFNPFLYFRF